MISLTNRHIIKITRIGLTTVLFAGIFFGFPACSTTSSKAFSESEIETIRSYADPETETTLQGLSENSITKYSRYFNEKMKAAVTQDVFDKTATQLNAQIGAYVSKEYLRAEEQGEYIIVHYRVKYTKGQVGVRMIFDKDNLVAGQWFE